MKSILSSFSKEFRQLITHVQQLQGITRVITGLLPESLQTHVRVANWRDGTLVMVADNAAAATELRFIQNDLLSRFRAEAELFSLRRIEIRVQTPSELALPTRAPRSPNPVTPAVGQQMAEMAGQVSDPPLQQALLRLAKTLRND